MIRKSYRIVLEIKPDPIDWSLQIGWLKGKASTMAYTFTPLFRFEFLFVSLTLYRFNHDYQ